jgi:vesicle coat complex subunit
MSSVFEFFSAHWPVTAALCLLACSGCAKQKTTEELMADLKAGNDRDRIIAVRTLPERQGKAEQMVPAMIAALKDHDGDVRRSAVIALGSMGEEAKEAMPALKALLHDRDARIRESVRTALSRIDPTKFSGSSKSEPGNSK